MDRTSEQSQGAAGGLHLLAERVWCGELTRTLAPIPSQQVNNVFAMETVPAADTGAPPIPRGCTQPAERGF